MALINDMYIFVKTEDVSRSVSISKHPVEEGIDLTDHVRRSPIALNVTGEIVGGDYEETVAQLHTVMSQGTLIEYIGINVFPDAVITQFNNTHSETIRGGCEFTMTIEEVRIATSPFTAMTANTGEQQVEQDTEVGKGKEQTHTVKRGDTLWGLAKAYYGNGSLFPRIFDANRDKLKNPDVIVDNQVLVIPQEGS